MPQINFFQKRILPGKQSLTRVLVTLLAHELARGWVHSSPMPTSDASRYRLQRSTANLLVLAALASPTLDRQAR
jgi:hypothetical protein